MPFGEALAPTAGLAGRSTLHGLTMVVQQNAFARWLGKQSRMGAIRRTCIVQMVIPIVFGEERLICNHHEFPSNVTNSQKSEEGYLSYSKFGRVCSHGYDVVLCRSLTTSRIQHNNLRPHFSLPTLWTLLWSSLGEDNVMVTNYANCCLSSTLDSLSPFHSSQSRIPSFGRKTFSLKWHN